MREKLATTARAFNSKFLKNCIFNCLRNLSAVHIITIFRASTLWTTQAKFTHIGYIFIGNDIITTKTPDRDDHLFGLEKVCKRENQFLEPVSAKLDPASKKGVKEDIQDTECPLF